MRNNLSIVLLGWLLAWGGIAQAQGLVERATDWKHPAGARVERTQAIRGLPTPAMTQYGGAVGGALGVEARGARIGHIYSVANDPAPRSVDGVGVALPDGTRFERFAFESEQGAFDYALYGAHLGEQGAVVEARGNEVLVIRGEGLDDPARAKRLTDAAWGAKAPSGPLTASATALPGGPIMLTTRRPDAILDREFAETITQLREGSEAGRPEFERLGAGDHFGYQLEGGANGAVQVADGFRSAIIATSAAQRQQLEEQLGRSVEAAFEPVVAEAADAGELTEEEILDRFRRQRERLQASQDPNGMFALGREHVLGETASGDTIVAIGSEDASGKRSWRRVNKGTGQAYDPAADGPVTNPVRGLVPRFPEDDQRRDSRGGSGRLDDIFGD